MSPDPLTASVWGFVLEECAFSTWRALNPNPPAPAFPACLCTHPFRAHMEHKFWGSWGNILNLNGTQTYLGKCFLNLANTCLVRKTSFIATWQRATARFIQSCFVTSRRMWTWDSPSVESHNGPPSCWKICPYSPRLLCLRNQLHFTRVLGPLHPIS